MEGKWAVTRGELMWPTKSVSPRFIEINIEALWWHSNKPMNKHSKWGDRKNTKRIVLIRGKKLQKSA